MTNIFNVSYVLSIVFGSFNLHNNLKRHGYLGRLTSTSGPCHFSDWLMIPKKKVEETLQLARSKEATLRTTGQQLSQTHHPHLRVLSDNSINQRLK